MIEDDWDDDEEFVEFALVVLFPRRARVIRDRPNHFQVWRDSKFKDRFRLNKDTVIFVLEQIKNSISSQSNRNHAVTPEQKLLLCLRYYATGSIITACADFTGIHKSTASRIIRQVSRALAFLRPRFVNFPETEEEQKDVKQKFYNIAKFPRCIGALDCTHIRIRSPGGDDAEIYRNRKGFFSFNVQTVCDAELRIQDIVSRWPGSTHDSTIFQNSYLRHRFETRQFSDSVLVADGGYAVKKYIMTPLSNTVTRSEELFNESLIRTRNTVERSYGVWKRRFPILALGINVRITSCESIVVATAVLHNIALHFGENTPRVTVQSENEINLTNFDSATLSNTGNRSIHRNPFINYFETLE